jgi:hypothetical protein
MIKAMIVTGPARDRRIEAVQPSARRVALGGKEKDLRGRKALGDFEMKK